jgi:1-acyl-sn-glycerol-3-phosphate acyltransferase
MMKKEWFFWPLGPIFKRMGGIPVYREKNRSVTDVLAQQAREADEFRLCITPEGTRRRQPEWKKGFYYIALKAELPILLYGLDYKRRLIQCTKQVIPDGDFDKQIVEIKQYFEGFQGKYPEKFTTGL